MLWLCLAHIAVSLSFPAFFGRGGGTSHCSVVQSKYAVKLGTGVSV